MIFFNTRYDSRSHWWAQALLVIGSRGLFVFIKIFNIYYLLLISFMTLFNFVYSFMLSQGARRVKQSCLWQVCSPSGSKFLICEWRESVALAQRCEPVGLESRSHWWAQALLVIGTTKKHLSVLLFGSPKGTRTPVTGVRGQCPRPLDDETIFYLT